MTESPKPRPDPGAFDRGVFVNLVCMQAEIIWSLHHATSTKTDEEFAHAAAERAVAIVLDRFSAADSSGAWDAALRKQAPAIVDLVARMLLPPPE